MLKEYFISDIINIISRITKHCTLRLTPNELCFSIGDDRASMVWAELRQTHYFTEYVMSGVTEEQNEIYLELDASMLARSLRATARSIKIKLTNKGQPCLTLEIQLPSLSIESQQCLHDVPVRVIPRREWAEHRAPDIPEFDVYNILFRSIVLSFIIIMYVSSIFFFRYQLICLNLSM